MWNPEIAASIRNQISMPQPSGVEPEALFSF